MGQHCRVWTDGSVIPIRKTSETQDHQDQEKGELKGKILQINTHMRYLSLSYQSANDISSIMVTTKPSRAILCLHGGGASPAIFRFQLATFRAALKNDFEFAYAEAPHIAVAGPDVLPFFAGMDPYYSWFRRDAESTADEVAAFNASIQKSVEKWERTNPDCKIVGVLGFSQGGLAATVLLWEQQMGYLPWLPALQFGVLICSASSEVATGYIRGKCEGDAEKAIIKTPSLHLHGRQDCNLGQARENLATHYLSESAHVIEFEGGHHVPKKWDDLDKVTQHLRLLTGSVSI